MQNTIIGWIAAGYALAMTKADKDAIGLRKNIVIANEVKQSGK